MLVDVLELRVAIGMIRAFFGLLHVQRSGDMRVAPRQRLHQGFQRPRQLGIPDHERVAAPAKLAPRAGPSAEPAS